MSDVWMGLNKLEACTARKVPYWQSANLGLGLGQQLTQTQMSQLTWRLHSLYS